MTWIMRNGLSNFVSNFGCPESLFGYFLPVYGHTSCLFGRFCRFMVIFCVSMVVVCLFRIILHDYSKPNLCVMRISLLF